MLKYQRVLLSLLSGQETFFAKKDHLLFSGDVNVFVELFTVEELANLYVDTGFLQTVLSFLEEQHWLQKKQNPNIDLIFERFLDPFLKIELSPLVFLHEFLKASSIAHKKILDSKSHCIEIVILQVIKRRAYSEQKLFAGQVLILISDLFEFENLLGLEKLGRGEHLALSIYRTYDSLDELFNLNYLADRGMKSILENTERLYEGAGIGVQSGYSTVLTAIRYLKPLQGARFVDLGSGYGRLGLVIGILRPDIDFKGYEFIQHRVDITMATVLNFNMQGHVQMYTQDLALKEFLIPDADIYYLYDPFSDVTYGHVLSQLVSISLKHKISIVTKGNARAWLIDIVQSNCWPPPQEFNNGNLCLFSSQ